ncbi:hypothetical protein BIY24_11080 [Halobacteriovorax marinus]|uniref:hypothetical protein n=1 Tax=Halobacteriovorax marinus TaxID=97084 RepID=UPI0003072CF8|nr:hypothetical protein [Halobacteriovorax marinus]ATH08472.1 hypothetical protein BIY24_11080 [Halobacteriovorax marinus]
MKILFISLFILFGTSIQAKDKFLCSALTLYKYRSLVPKTEFDKVKHCTYSCIMAKKCGALESWSVGIAKEIADLLGMGTPDLEDIAANKLGIRLSKKIDHINECLPSCRELYDNGYL